MIPVYHVPRCPYKISSPDFTKAESAKETSPGAEYNHRRGWERFTQAKWVRKGCWRRQGNRGRGRGDMLTRIVNYIVFFFRRHNPL